MTHYAGDRYEAVVDGHIYDAPVDVRTLVELVHAGERDRIRELLPAIDGSFVVYDERTGVYRGINDAFARLPLYYLETEPALSREPTVLFDLLDDPAFDPMGVTQMLVFRYPLGQRTPIVGVSTVARLRLDRFDATFEIPDDVSAEIESDAVDVEEFTLSAAMDLYTLERLANELDSSLVTPPRPEQ